MQWFRRALLTAVLAVIGGLLYGRLSHRAPEPAGVAEWPPLAPASPTAASPAPVASPTVDNELSADTALFADTPVQSADDAEQSAHEVPAVKLVAEAPPTLTETLQILVDRPPSASDTWVLPLDDGSCPDGFPVKANDGSGIFHIPGGRFYERTHPERCYARGEDAEADGYRQAKA